MGQKISNEVVEKISNEAGEKISNEVSEKISNKADAKISNEVSERNEIPHHDRRVIHVFWKHRINATSDYMFMGPAIIGKSLKITVNGKQDYSVDELKTEILNKYIN